MKIIQPSVKILTSEDPIEILKRIERCARVCYKSEDKITSDSYIKFLEGVIKRGHLSVIEHGAITVLVACDRGVSHEIVRHRIGSYSQESTRYVNYNKNGIEVIKPTQLGKEWVEDNKEEEKRWYSFISAKWESAIEFAENIYKDLINMGVAPEIARSVLPNALKTEIAITYNLREWRHFFQLRGSKAAHPQIREIAIMILEELQKWIPVVFSDLAVIDKNGMKIIKVGGE